MLTKIILILVAVIITITITQSINIYIRGIFISRGTTTKS
jgi:hypothetical protein